VIPLKVMINVEEAPIVSPEERPLQYPQDVLADISAMGVLIEGTKEGRPVVIVRIDLPDGKFVLAQTTLRLFLAASIAFAAKYVRQDEN
jgi:hypothetical protein